MIPAVKREVRQGAPDLVAIFDMDADRGGGVVEVGLAHEVVIQPAAVESVLDREQLVLGVDGQDNDPNRAGVSWVEGFAGGVR